MRPIIMNAFDARGMTLDEFIQTDICFQWLPEFKHRFTSNPTRVGSNTLYLVRWLKLWSLRYGVSLPDDLDNAKISLLVDNEIAKYTGGHCHWGYFVYNGAVFATILINKHDIKEIVVPVNKK